MKKLLLSCFFALGIGASAQYNYLGNFEEDDVSMYGQFGGGTITAAAACNGSWGGQLATSSSVTQTGWMLELDALQGQTNNGQAATVSIKYKKASGPVGTLYLSLFIYDADSDAWDIVPIATGVSLTSAAITTCSTITGTIPAGTLQADKSYAVGGFYVRATTGGGSGNIYIDDISIVQDIVTTIPSCGALTSPTNSSTINAGTYNFTWATVPTAVNYKLTVGSAAGGSDVYNGTIPGNMTSQYVGLETNKTYYAKLVPVNAIGSATGCTEISFNTNSTIGYCSATAPTYTNTTFEIISRVRFAGIDNTSPTTAGTPGYEDFTSKVGNVNVGQTYPITVNITGFDSAGPDKTSVWIDYNQDGIFTDSEKTVLSNAATATGNILIPTTAKSGNTRMRVSMNYSADPVSCGTQQYGQVEDYTINVNVPTTPPDCTTFTYPATDGATGITPNPAPLTWTAKEAIGYKVYIGTTPGGTNIANGVTVTTNAYSPTLATNTTYYAKVVPYNVVGDATSCTEISFTTGNVVYCTATTTQTSGEKISRVQFSNIDQASTATVGYEDYTAVVGNTSQSATVPITVTLSATNNNAKVRVWIDYNQNGTFEDSEGTNLTVSGTSATGSIIVPVGAKPGSTRMRVRLNRAASAPVACGSVTTQGQVEDYTVNIEEILPACTVVTTPADGATGVAVNPTLAWTAIANATGYKLYLGTTSGGSDVLNGVSVTSGAFYNVTSLANNTMYYAKVVAYNGKGDATGCSETSFTTIVALPSCATLSSPANGATGVAVSSTLSWTAVSGATGYKLYLGTTSGGSDVLNGVDVTTGTSYDVSSLANNTMYYAKVVPYNVAGDATGCSETTFTTIVALPSCTSLSAPADGSTGVVTNPTLSWPTVSGATGYKLSLGTTSGGSDILNAVDVTGTSYNVSSLALNTTYFAKVIPYNAAGNATGCSETTFTTAAMAVLDVNKANISVYPNPFTDVLKISDVKGIKSISVNDVSGRLVKSLEPSTELNLSSLKSGMYIINLNMQDGTVKSLKAIKK